MADPVPHSPSPDDRLLAAVRTGLIASARSAFHDGASVDARDAQGKTGLHLAISGKDYGSYNNIGREMLSLFLNRKLDINAPDHQGATALHDAMLDDAYTTCKYKIEDLVKFGADVNARDKQGRTPLHYAADRGNKNEGLKTLLSLRADVNARDHDGATPLHLAAARGDQDVVKALLAQGANAQWLTKTGQSVGDFAEQGGHEYLAQSLRAEADKQYRAYVAWEKAQKADPWTLLAKDRVACVRTEKKIGYRLTEIFDFHARTYTKIAHNLQTKVEGVTDKGFDEFADKSILEKAHGELLRLDGDAPRDVIYGPVMDKPRKPAKRLGPKN